MRKSLDELLKYPFEFQEDDDNSYLFVTQNKITYLVKFKPTDYLFPAGSPYNERIFEFVIEVFRNPTGKNPPFDNLTSTTVAAIFKDFFDREKETIAIYICDSSDSKQAVRQRKFTLWFDAYNLNDKYMKFDLAIRDKNGIKYPISVMLRMDNPHNSEIIQLFNMMALEYNK